MAKSSRKKKKAQQKKVNAQNSSKAKSTTKVEAGEPEEAVKVAEATSANESNNTNNNSQDKVETNNSQQTTDNTDTNKKEERKKTPFFYNVEFAKKPKEYFAMFIPVILVLGYIPILMRTLSFSTFLDEFEWVSESNSTQVDVFLKIKAIALVVVAAVMLLIMLIWFFNGKRNVFKRMKSVPFYLIGVAVIFVILSGIFASNKPLLLLGGFENFESIFVTLSYFIVMIYAFILFSQSDSVYRDMQFVYRASLPGFLIISVIGLFQVFGLDLFKTEFGKFLFASSEYRQPGATINVGTGEYTTLHNIDYVSTFFAMWAMIFLIMFTMGKNPKEKIVRGALLVLTLFDMFAAGSDGGRLGFIGGIIVLAILVCIKDVKKLAVIGGILVVGIIAVFAVPQLRNYVVSGIGASDSSSETAYRIHHITPKDDGVYFDLDGKEYSIAYTHDNNILKVELKNADGSPINGTYHEAANKQPQYYEYSSNDIGKNGLKIYDYKAKTSQDSKKILKGIMLGEKDEKGTFVVSNQVEGKSGYYYLNPYGRFVQDDGSDIEKAGVFPDQLFSSRGKIWNKTLPLLKNHLLIGCGSGLFITVFPQNDYIDKMFINTNYDVKPHNLYAQYWVEEGLPFLLCVLAFFVIFYVMIIKGLVVKEGGITNEGNRRIAIACAASVTVFLVAGIPGDSMIVHSPTFWTFLGIGMAAGWTELRRKKQS